MSDKNQGVRAPVRSDSVSIDFAILTALEVERKAVCAAFGLGVKDRVKKADAWYWRGTIPLADGSKYEIVVAQPIDMGNVEAALLTSEVFHVWQPRAALLVGIAASTDPDKVKLGDVVVGQSIWYYEHRKLKRGRTSAQPLMINASSRLLKHVIGLEDWAGTVALARPDGTANTPKRHLGVIASGEKVIANAAIRDKIASEHRKILAVEMEGYGFSLAVSRDSERVQHMAIRGICDGATEDKDDLWHAYAAAAAASFAKHLLLDRPLEPVIEDARTEIAEQADTTSSRNRQPIRLFDDVLLLLEHHKLLYAAHPAARLGGYGMAGSIGPIAAGLMRYEGMSANYFPGPAGINELGEPTGFAEVAVGIHPSGDFVVGFTHVAEVDSGWLERLGALLRDLEPRGGTARTYHLYEPWVEHPAIPLISIRSELNRIVGLAMRRHATTCVKLWSENDERQFRHAPSLLLRTGEVVHVSELLPRSRENKRLMLLAASAPERTILLRRCAAMLGNAYLQDAENEPAPLFIDLAGETPDWNLLLWQRFPDLNVDPLRLAIGSDMVIPLLDGLERLNLHGNTVTQVPDFITESFGPYSSVITSCSSQFYDTLCARGILSPHDGGLRSTVSIIQGYPPGTTRGNPTHL